ncbi:MAG: glycosyltransferase family 1 protein [Bacteroidales bacterium]|nr:glycosyltransferase family 1 protein [Bacteroidales bacterium]
MVKRFDRALLLCPEKYSFSNSFKEILAILAGEVRSYDLGTEISNTDLKINSQIFRLPYIARKRWESYFQEKANRMLISVIASFEPDIILVYNSSFLLPETCALMRKRASLVFFMGDSPFYTPQNNYYLACLPHADLILSPDSLWSQQLNTIGLSRTMYFLPGPDSNSYFKIENPVWSAEDIETEILYVGSSYLNSWGYKKALLMSRFTEFKFIIYGNSAWKRWFSFFPGLELVYRESGFITQEKINRMFNKTRLIPVDGNPGILNGVHLRLFEALSAGALPLIEYRNDLDNLLFRDFRGELPLIRDYSKAADLASHYLRNEAERSALVASMNDYLAREYSAAANAERLAEALNK